MEVEQGTFTPLIFSSTGGIGAECKLYHKRLVELRHHNAMGQSKSIVRSYTLSPALSKRVSID